MPDQKTDAEDLSFFWCEDDGDKAMVSRWLAAAYGAVVEVATGLHGPLDRFWFEEAYTSPEGVVMGYDLLTGEYCGGKVPMCDGSREAGGAFARFFKAHNGISRWVDDHLAWGYGSVTVDLVNYGRALGELSALVPAFEYHRSQTVKPDGTFGPDLDA